MDYKTKLGLLWGGDDLAVDKELISQIKSSTNIVDVIGEVVSLSKAGRNYLGNCPFHKEKTPSFNVVEDKQFYHCFGCGKSGDVFRFLEDYRQISFMDSVAILADRLGIALQLPTGPASQSPAHPHQVLIDMHQEAAKFYQAILTTTKMGEEARNYLYQRGLTDDLIAHFGIGLAPDGADFLYQKLASKYEETDLLDSGLFHHSDSGQIFDSFRQRITFPLKDDKGQVIAFSGRIWLETGDDKQVAKYKNTRATSIFNKSYELYHLDQAKAVIKKTKEVYLMEGFMDVIAAYRAGFDNAVASMGTALTLEHVNHLRNFCQSVVLTYDGDRAGQAAIAKSLDLLADFKVSIVRIPNQMDPDEFVQANSPEALAQLLTQSRISSTEFWLTYLRPDNLDNLQAQIAYVEQIAPLIAREQSITAQNTYIHLVADDLPDFDYGQIEQAVNQARLQSRAQRQNRQEGSSQPFVQNLPQTKVKSGLLRAENQLFHRLLHHDFLLNDFRNREQFAFETPALEGLYQLLKTQGELTDWDISQLPEDQTQAYYQVLEESLPENFSDEEIFQLEKRIDKYRQEQDLRRRSKQIREASNQGDLDSAVDQLAALIAQKRQLE